MRASQILVPIVCWAILASFGAQAQTESSTTLTRDELRACMLQEASLRNKSEAQQGDAARSNEEAASIAAESANLIRASVNGFKDRTARDSHIARSNSLNKRVESFNAKSKQIRLALADIQTLQSEYLRKCGGKSFYQEDKDSILAERETNKSGARTPAQAASATQPN